MLVNLENYYPVYPQTDRFCDMHLSVLFHAFHTGKQWDLENLAAPHWRLYWNSLPGAGVIHDNKVTPLDPSHMYLIPANTPFSSRSQGRFSQFFVHFILSGDFEDARIGIYASPLCKRRRKMIEQIKEMSRKGVLGNQTGTLAVQRLIIDLLAELPQDLWITNIIDPRIHAALKTIKEKGLNAQIKNNQLAKAANLSPNAFIRLFTQQMGMAPMRYLTHKRLDRAAILLRFTKQSIESISEICGFCDRYHLSKLFKRKYSVGPAQYRRKRLH